MLRLVPVQYLADGNDRLPDTSDSQIALYRDTIYRMYPTAKVSVSVRSPFPWTQTVSADGTGWDELLIGVANLRVSDNLPDQVYDIAAFEPASSLGKFCSVGGCVVDA